MFWRIATPETSDLPDLLAVRFCTPLLLISIEDAMSPKTLEKSLSNRIVLEGDRHASIFRYRDTWNTPKPGGGGNKFASFEFPLFVPSLAHELPSPYSDPLPPHPSILAKESAKWNAAYGRPSVYSKRDSHYGDSGSTSIPEAEEEDDFHRTNDIVFIAFYPIGEVHPKPHTRGDITYNPKWSVHYVPQYVARLARILKVPLILVALAVLKTDFVIAVYGEKESRGNGARRGWCHREHAQRLGGCPHTPTPSRSQFTTEKGETCGNGIPVSVSVGLHWVHVSPCTSSPTRPTYLTEMNLDGYDGNGNGSTDVKRESEDGMKGKGKDT
jgi:hypothetical protein